MKYINKWIILSLFFASCGNSNLSVSRIGKQVASLELNRVYVQSFVFGTTTGECIFNCMPRFKLTYQQGKSILKLDNAHRRYDDSLTYEIDLSNDTSKVRIAKEILRKMPPQLYNNRTGGQRFGSCAPCRDGTEVNIQIISSIGGIKHFVITPYESPEQGVPYEVSIYAKEVMRKVQRVLLREWHPLLKYQEMIEGTN